MADEFAVGNETLKGAQDVFSNMLMVDPEGEDVIVNKRCEIQSNLTSMIGLGRGLGEF